MAERRKEVLKELFPNYKVIPNLDDIPEICPKEIENYKGFCDKAEPHSITCIACRIHYWNRYTTVTDFQAVYEKKDENGDKDEIRPADGFYLFSLTGTRKDGEKR